MGNVTALSLLCLAVSIFSCAILEAETLTSDERQKREDNVSEVNQQSEDHFAHELSARSQRKKSTTTLEQLTDEMEQLRRSQRSLEDWRTNLLKEKLRTKRESSAGSTFVRWGRKSCPYGTSMIYVGIVGGKQHKEKGSGTNYLCLTKAIRFDYVSPAQGQSRLSGGEYDNKDSHKWHNVPCSVCLAPKPNTIMVPGTNSCPSGWTRQYYGHLASAAYDQFASEYVCLDKHPEDADGGHKYEDGALFYYTFTKCKALSCPPFKEDQVITCVVCSK